MHRLRRCAWRHGAACSGPRRSAIGSRIRCGWREALGGEAITVPGGGRSIADDVISFAQANNVTQIIIGKSARSRWFEILHGSVVHDLVRRSGNISVHVIAGDELARDPIPKKTRTCRRKAQRLSTRGRMWWRWPRLPPPSASAS